MIKRISKMSESVLSVKHMVSVWLSEHGYSGLFNENDDCGCAMFDGLMPCGSGGIDECLAAYAYKIKDLPDEKVKELEAEFGESLEDEFGEYIVMLRPLDADNEAIQ